MEQTLDNVEYIFVDDNSPDASIEIFKRTVAQYPKRTPNVKIIKHQHNQGVSDSRATGLSEALGEYVFFCDSDDLLDRRMLQMMYETCKVGNFDMAYCDIKFLEDSNGQETIFHYNCEPHKELLIKHLIRMRALGLGGSLWTKFFKRELLDGVCYLRNQLLEDRPIILQAMLKAHTFGYVQEPLYIYRQHEASVLHQRGCCEREYKRICDAKENVALMVDLLKTYDCYRQYAKDVIYTKLVVQSWCEDRMMNIDKRCFRTLWRQNYPELLREVLFQSDLNLRSRLSYIRKWLRYNLKK